MDSSIHIHINKTKTVGELWKKFKSVFADDEFTRRESLLRLLVLAKSEDCQSFKKVMFLLVGVTTVEMKKIPRNSAITPECLVQKITILIRVQVYT